MIWARIKGDVQSRSRTFNIVLTVLLLLTVGARRQQSSMVPTYNARDSLHRPAWRHRYDLCQRFDARY